MAKLLKNDSRKEKDTVLVSVCGSERGRLKKSCAVQAHTEKPNEGQSWTLNFLLIGVRPRAINLLLARNEINR